MMVRVRTDVPAPEGPTKPWISAALTSRLRPSSTVVEPNCTEMSRTRMIASCCWICTGTWGWLRHHLRNGRSET